MRVVVRPFMKTRRSDKSRRRRVMTRLFFIRLRRRFRGFMVRFKSDEKVIDGAYRYFGIDKTYADLVAEIKAEGWKSPGSA